LRQLHSTVHELRDSLDDERAKQVEQVAALEHARRAEAAQLQGTIQALRTELEAAHGRR
jgi:hypothetical protein